MRMGELIRREDVHTIIVLACKSHDRSDVLMAIRRGVKNIPSVDAVPVVHGRWIYHDDDWMPWVSCSECGVCTDIANKTPYCPNCGAKMDGGTEL